MKAVFSQFSVLNYSKFSKVLLFLGIALYVVGFISLNIIGQFFETTQNPQQPLFEILSIFPPIVGISLMVVFAPIVEELAFRGWIIKKLYGKIISYAGIVFFVQATVDNVYLSSGVIGALFPVFFLLKNSEVKTLVLILVTSILFGLAHISNYSAVAVKIVAITQIIGLAFIICYVGLKFGFIYTMLVHFANNLLAIIVMYAFLSNYSGSFENTFYKTDLERKSVFDLSKKELTLVGDDTIYAEATITQIAETLAGDKKDELYLPQISNLILYKFNAVAKADTLKREHYPTCRQVLFTDLVKHANLKLDTTYETAYVLSIVDSVKFAEGSKASDSYTTYVYSLVGSIRSIYKLPVLFPDFERKEFSVSLKLLRTKNTDEFIAKLKNEYGLLLQKDNTLKAKVIRISE